MKLADNPPATTSPLPRNPDDPDDFRGNIIIEQFKPPSLAALKDTTAAKLLKPRSDKPLATAPKTAVIPPAPLHKPPSNNSISNNNTMPASLVGKPPLDTTDASQKPKTPVSDIKPKQLRPPGATELSSEQQQQPKKEQQSRPDDVPIRDPPPPDAITDSRKRKAPDVALQQKQSPTPKRKNSLAVGLTPLELLAENRSLRLSVDNLKNENAALKSSYEQAKLALSSQESVLEKYRKQLIVAFEANEVAAKHLNFDDVAKKLILKTDFQAKKAIKEAASPKIMGIPTKPLDAISAPSLDSSGTEADITEDESDAKDAEIVNAVPQSVAFLQPQPAKKGKRRFGRAWTENDDKLFIDAYNKHGCKWKLIQASLPHKTRQQIQSHGSYLIKQGKLDKFNSRRYGKKKPSDGSEENSLGENRHEDESSVPSGANGAAVEKAPLSSSEKSREKDPFITENGGDDVHSSGEDSDEKKDLVPPPRAPIVKGSSSSEESLESDGSGTSA